jgi:hypothetical protein
VTGFVETHGRKPKTGERLLKVLFRNGMESRWEYTADQLVWQDRGWPFDIVGVKRA